MPKQKKEPIEELSKIDETIPTQPIVEQKVSEKTEFEVYTSQAGYVRTYSVEVHGADAGKLAHQYASKISGSVR